MGECAYRIKAKWPSPVPEETLKLIQKLFDENQEAYEYWQEHRDLSGEEFWLGFGKNFPVTAQYAKFMYGKDPEELSGKLDFGGEKHNFYYDSDDFEIFYEAEKVWHYSNWSPSRGMVSQSGSQ